MLFRTGVVLLALATSIGIEAWQTSAPAQPRTVKGRDFALVIATDTYDDPFWDDLRNPLFDARTIKADLEQTYGFEVELVADARLIDIQRKLREYVQQRKFAENDQLFVFFAGHGLFDPALDLGHIVAKDSRAPKDDDTLATYFSFSDLYRYVQRIPVKHLFLVLDVCHGGTFGDVMRGGDPDYRRATAVERITAAMQRPSRKFLTSGGNEYVSDGRPGSHSPFAFRFIEALRDVGQDGIVSALQIIDRVQTIQPNRPVWGDMAGASPGSDFLFVKRGTVAVPTTVAEAVASTAEEQKWTSIKDAREPDPFIDYLLEYPGGKYAALASERIRTIAAKNAERRAGTARVQEDIRIQLEATGVLFGAYGLGLIGVPQTGELAPGSTMTYSVNLQENVRYAISAACDLDCADLDIRVLDAKRKEVASIVDPDDEMPVLLQFKPPTSGTFTVRVEMVSCSVAPCAVGVATFGFRAAAFDTRSPRVRLQEFIRLVEQRVSIGYEIVDGSLAEKNSQSFPLDLSEGFDYLLLGLCDQECGDLDLHLLDAAGKVLVFDEKEDPFPMIESFIPKSNQRITLKVTMAGCAKQACAFSVAVMKFKPSPFLRVP